MPSDPPTPATDRWVAPVLLALVAAAFLVLAAPRIGAVFGDSDEGINAAVWASDSRALRELGPIDSRLGGRRDDGTEYANHPPLTVWEAAVVEQVAGEHEWASRAPAWLGALATIPLLYLLLRRARFEPLVAAFGAGAACLTPMFVVYGPMLDTPVTSLPFGVALLALWVRDVDVAPDSVRPPPWWGVLLLSAAACLVGWQAAVLVGACAASVAVHHRRDRALALRRTWPYVVGAVVGLAATFGWIWWVYGGFEPLTEKFSRRAGDAATSYLDVVTFQVPWILQLLSLSTVGLVACAVAVRDRRLRPLALMALLVTFGYALLFKEAAAGHQYWLYWELVPVAVGTAYLGGAIVRRIRAGSAAPQAPTITLAVVLVLLGVVNLVPETLAERLIVDGYAAADLVRGHTEADPIVYIGEAYRPDGYVAYYRRTLPEPIGDQAALDALAREDPGAGVLVLTGCDAGDAGDLCRRILAGLPPADTARWITAGELARAVDSG